MSDKTGGPAFPIPLNEGDQWRGPGSENGMTLRDYFAAKAMASVLIIGAKPAEMLDDGDIEPTEPYYFGNWHSEGNELWGRNVLARDAYQVADAMLAARHAAAGEGE